MSEADPYANWSLSDRLQMLAFEAVVHHLDQLKVAQSMRAHPEGRLVVVQKGLTVALDEPL
jgi:hypothetical protein